MTGLIGFELNVGPNSQFVITGSSFVLTAPTEGWRVRHDEYQYLRFTVLMDR